MRLTRPALALAALGTCLALVPAASAAKVTAWNDKAGDGNAINGQVLNAPALDGGTVTPTSTPGRDLLKVAFTQLTKKVGKKTVCDGFTLTMTLAGPPVKDSQYRVDATTAENGEIFYIAYNTTDGATDLRYSSSATQDDTIGLKKGAKVKGNTITFQVLLSDLTQANEGSGSILESLSAGANANTAVPGVVSAFVPFYDKSAPPAGTTYKVCS